MSTEAFAAASDSTTIDIQVVHQQAQQKIKLTGTITSNTLKTFNENNLKSHANNKKTIKLGSFGIRSNIKGNCRLDFDSVNQFRLKHSAIADMYSSRYQITLNNKKLDKHNKTIQESSCNFDSKALRLHILDNFGGIQTGLSGYYWDTIMITVTAP